MFEERIYMQGNLQEIQTKLQGEDEMGFLTGKMAFLFQPRFFVLVGNLEQFVSDQGVNEQQLVSFELFRRKIKNPGDTQDPQLPQNRSLTSDSTSVKS
jgi:hypothetical protein